MIRGRLVAKKDIPKQEEEVLIRLVANIGVPAWDWYFTAPPIQPEINSKVSKRSDDTNRLEIALAVNDDE